MRRLARAGHAKASHLARAKASVTAGLRVSHARASLPTRAEASAASGPSRGAAANSLITGATDKHTSVLFEVMFRKNNDLRGNNRIEGQMWVPRVNGQTKCVVLSCLVSTAVWANPVINGFKLTKSVGSSFWRGLRNFGYVFATFCTIDSS